MAFAEHHPDAPQKFQRFAATAVEWAKKYHGVDISYDLKSVQKLDKIAEKIDKSSEDNLEKAVLVYGAFLGEVIRQLYNGRWEWDDHYKTWGVTFALPGGKEDSAFVFAKVQKRLKNGMDDSVSFLVEVIDQRVKGKIP